ncbi:hypothetical protein SE_1362 [Staphylococcus epidermidis ATCC 12228]|uniref:Uncharacterized protein n=1 Tax=Staphylococcus epidermidis (strain ATCC 12228 / FDA PCI 1200) TaxID=176280 RepID=A0A0H2VGN3_STAES|nr:hypothetical protein SE_1362 [Staphylococcus epidermidis ATCC 12228]
MKAFTDKFIYKYKLSFIIYKILIQTLTMELNK